MSSRQLKALRKTQEDSADISEDHMVDIDERTINQPKKSTFVSYR
jgi:hypothetical protein